VVNAVLDTNILIDDRKGYPQANAEVHRHTRPAISILTWMEIMVGAKPGAAPAMFAFLADVELLPLDNLIARRAVALRREHRLRVPDAIISASAQIHSLPLVTRNTKDFPTNARSIRTPYLL
jgi:predicted nucleic acid-binding protein